MAGGSHLRFLVDEGTADRMDRVVGVNGGEIVLKQQRGSDFYYEVVKR